MKKDKRYDFKEEKVNSVLNFFKLLKLWQGDKAGQPFIPEPWQTFALANIYGFYRKGTDNRVFSDFFCCVARKSGKSSFVAAIELYELFLGDLGGQVFCIANSRQQAHLLFDSCQNFSKSIDPNSKYTKQYRDRLTFKPKNSYLEVLSSDTARLDGLNPSSAVLDEAHENRDDKLYSILKTGMGARRNALMTVISTCGYRTDTFFKNYYDTVEKILEGEIENDTIFGMIFTLDKGDAWDDPKVWIKSNPSLGVTVTEQYIANQVARAKSIASEENSVRVKNLNTWTSSSSVWLAQDLVASHMKKLDMEIFEGRSVGMGVDLASVTDTTALSICAEIDGRYHFKCWTYVPSEQLKYGVNSSNYRIWSKHGYLTVNEGNVTDYDFILADMLKIADKCEVLQCNYDQYNATYLAIKAVENGINMTPYSQSIFNFNKVTKEFERQLKLGNIYIDDNPITLWNFQNATLKVDKSGNENCKPMKGGAISDKIDNIIAMLQAFAVFVESPEYSGEIASLSY